MSKSATATWLFSDAPTSAFSSVRSSRSPPGRPVSASKRPRRIVSRRSSSAARRSRSFSPRTLAQLPRRLGEADELFGSPGRHAPVEEALEDVARPRLQRRRHLARAGAERENRHGRAVAELPNGLTQAPAALVAEGRVSQDDSRTKPAELLEGLPHVLDGVDLEARGGEPGRRLLATPAIGKGEERPADAGPGLVSAGAVPAARWSGIRASATLCLE